VYSLASMPIFGRMHASGSQPPVTAAIFGMSPSLRLRGSRSMLPATGLSTHCFTWGRTNWRRHLPIWTTSGMFEPTGTSLRTKSPFASVSVVTMGEPETVEPHLSQVAPVVIRSTGAFGT